MIFNHWIFFVAIEAGPRQAKCKQSVIVFQQNKIVIMWLLKALEAKSELILRFYEV